MIGKLLRSNLISVAPASAVALPIVAGIAFQCGAASVGWGSAAAAIVSIVIAVIAYLDGKYA